MTNVELGSSKVKLEYNLLSVEKIDTPEGMPEGNWHRYVITRGNSVTEGMQAGTLAAVTKYAEDFVEVLNERAATGHSTYAARKKK